LPVYGPGVLVQAQSLLLLHGLLDPNVWADRFGAGALWGIALIVFIECWLFPFLPGDSLLFVLGLLASQGKLPQPLWLACLVVTAAAVLSNVVGYLVGAQIGPAVFNRPHSRVFKPAHVERTHAFFDRYGNRAIVLARFVPIVRTLITLAAGAGRMPMRRFVAYSAVGGIAWATGVTLLGYYLGQVDFLAQHIDVVLIVLVALSAVPLVAEYLRSRRGDARAGEGRAGSQRRGADRRTRS
jgi:membrane protein DedA with SNARE-associated domain